MNQFSIGIIVHYKQFETHDIFLPAKRHKIIQTWTNANDAFQHIISTFVLTLGRYFAPS